MPFEEFADYRTLSSTINEIKSPNQLVKTLLFSKEETLHTKFVEWGLLTGPRKIAPFIKRNGEAVMVEKLGKGISAIKPPDIRIKMPFTAGELIYPRFVGTGFFPTVVQHRNAVRQKVARDIEQLEFYIRNSEEYLCALALTGTIVYESEDEESFSVTYPKPAGHTIDLGATKYWDNGSAVNINVDIYTVKKLISDEHQLSTTDCILGSEAALAVMAMKETERNLLDNRRIFFGDVDFTRQFEETGAIYLGMLGGVRFWSYPRTVLVKGVSTPLIRAKYAEFVSATMDAQNVMYYGAIPDMDAWETGQWIGRRFSKTWRQKDPSVDYILACSAPLPAMRRPGSVVSLKVVSG